MIDVEDEAMLLKQGSPQSEDDPMDEKYSEEKPK